MLVEEAHLKSPFSLLLSSHTSFGELKLCISYWRQIWCRKLVYHIPLIFLHVIWTHMCIWNLLPVWPNILRYGKLRDNCRVRGSGWRWLQMSQKPIRPNILAKLQLKFHPKCFCPDDKDPSACGDPGVHIFASLLLQQMPHCEHTFLPEDSISFDFYVLLFSPIWEFSLH